MGGLEVDWFWIGFWVGVGIRTEVWGWIRTSGGRMRREAKVDSDGIRSCSAANVEAEGDGVDERSVSGDNSWRSGGGTNGSSISKPPGMSRNDRDGGSSRGRDSSSCSSVSDE